MSYIVVIQLTFLLESPMFLYLSFCMSDDESDFQT